MHRREEVCHRPFVDTPRRTTANSSLDRTLTVPPEYGYGDRGIGPIPGGSTLSAISPTPPQHWLE